MNTEYTTIESFRDNGFILIPELLSPQEIGALRSAIQSIINAAPAEKRMLTIGDLLGNPVLLEALTQIQFNTRLLERLSAVIGGDVCYINNLNLQCNMFGIGAWHTDCGSEMDSRNLYLYDLRYMFGKVGVYLQDNTAEFGGGINVLSGSHKAFKQLFFARSLSYLYSNFRTRAHLGMQRIFKERELLVPIKAGSAVYFDSRLLHRSTPPQSLVLDETQKAAQRLQTDMIGAANAKYVLYWEACSKHCADSFLKNSCRRAISEEIGIREPAAREKFFTEYLGYHYPGDYPQSYVDRCSHTPVSIASLDARISDFWKTARDL